MNTMTRHITKASLVLSLLVGTTMHSKQDLRQPVLLGENIEMVYSINETQPWVKEEATVLNTIIIPAVVGMTVGAVAEYTGASNLIRNNMKHDAGVPIAIAAILAIDRYADKWARSMHKDLRTPESTALIRKMIACSGLYFGAKLTK